MLLMLLMLLLLLSSRGIKRGENMMLDASASYDDDKSPDLPKVLHLYYFNYHDILSLLLL